MAIDGQIVGLDIGQSHITAVRLAQRDTEDGVVLEPIMVEEMGLPRETLDYQGRLVRPHIVLDAVKTLRKKHKLKNYPTVLGLSGGALSIQPVVHPASLQGEDLMSAIALEIEPGLPYRDHAHIDYQEIRSNLNEDGTGTVELLTVAVDRYVPITLARAVNAAGLQVVDILAEPCVLHRAADLSPDQTEVLLAIGMMSSSMMLIREGRVHVAQSIPFGAEHFTQALVRQGLSPAEAERWKHTHSLVSPDPEKDPDAELRVALQSTVDSFLENLFTLIQHAANESDSGINRLVLAGGGAKLSGLLGYLNNSLALPVELIRPSRELLLPDDTEDFPRQAFAYALAMTDSAEVRMRR